MGSTSKERLRALWIDCLGLTIEGHYPRASARIVDEDIARRSRGARPLRGRPDAAHSILAAQAGGARPAAEPHRACGSTTCRGASQWLMAQGVRFAPGGIRRARAGHDITFIHPKGNDAFPIGGEGVLIELVQAPPEIIASYGPNEAYATPEMRQSPDNASPLHRPYTS